MGAGERDETDVVATTRAELARAPDGDARLAILLAAVGAHPHSATLRWQLYDAYTAIGEAAAAERQLAEGARLGVLDFLIEQAAAHPASLDADAVSTIERERPLLAVGVSIARGQAPAGRARLARVLEERTGSAYRGRGLSREDWSLVMATAVEHGELELARWMLSVVRGDARGFDDVPREERPGGLAAEVRVAALAELLDATLELPPEYRAPFAAGLRVRTEREREHLLLGPRDRSQDTPQRVARWLETRAPVLASIYAEVLRRPVGDARPAWHSPRRVVAIVLGGLCLLWLAVQASLQPTDQPLRRRTIEAARQAELLAASRDAGVR